MGINYIFISIARFVLLLLLQVLVLNNISFFGLATPMIYPLAILLLPVRMPPAVVLLIAFGYGLSLDVFSDTGGIHAGSLTILAFARKGAMGLLEPQAGYQPEALPSLRQQGVRWFAIYSLALLFLHHFFFYFFESMTFMNAGLTLVRIILSLIFSWILIWILQIVLQTD